MQRTIWIEFDQNRLEYFSDQQRDHKGEYKKTCVNEIIPISLKYLQNSQFYWFSFDRNMSYKEQFFSYLGAMGKMRYLFVFTLKKNTTAAMNPEKNNPISPKTFFIYLPGWNPELIPQFLYQILWYTFLPYTLERS